MERRIEMERTWPGLALLGTVLLKQLLMKDAVYRTSSPWSSPTALLLMFYHCYANLLPFMPQIE